HVLFFYRGPDPTRVRRRLYRASDRGLGDAAGPQLALASGPSRYSDDRVGAGSRRHVPARPSTTCSAPTAPAWPPRPPARPSPSRTPNQRQSLLKLQPLGQPSDEPSLQRDEYDRAGERGEKVGRRLGAVWEDLGLDPARRAQAEHGDAEREREVLRVVDHR